MLYFLGLVQFTFEALANSRIASSKLFAHAASLRLTCASPVPRGKLEINVPPLAFPFSSKDDTDLFTSTYLGSKCCYISCHLACSCC